MSGRHRRIEMHYSEFEKTSLVNCAYILIQTGTTWFGLPCQTNHVKDVSLNGTNINNYLPQEHIRLLRESEGSVATIFAHNGEAHYYAIEGDNVVSKGHDNNCC